MSARVRRTLPRTQSCASPGGAMLWTSICTDLRISAAGLDAGGAPPVECQRGSTTLSPLAASLGASGTHSASVPSAAPCRSTASPRGSVSALAEVSPSGSQTRTESSPARVDSVTAGTSLAASSLPREGPARCPESERPSSRTHVASATPSATETARPPFASPRPRAAAPGSTAPAPGRRLLSTIRPPAATSPLPRRLGATLDALRTAECISSDSRARHHIFTAPGRPQWRASPPCAENAARTRPPEAAAARLARQRRRQREQRRRARRNQRRARLDRQGARRAARTS